MLSQQSSGGSYISGLLPSMSSVKKRWDKRLAFCNHCPVDVLIVAGKPMAITVLHRQTPATRIELRQEESGRITLLEVVAVKSSPIVVGVMQRTT
jgi:hypothetical protein